MACAAGVIIAIHGNGNVHLADDHGRYRRLSGDYDGPDYTAVAQDFFRPPRHRRLKTGR